MSGTIWCWVTSADSDGESENVGAFGDPAANQLEFGGRERRAVLRRHFAGRDHLHQQALVGLAGDNHRAGFASLEQIAAGGQAQRGIAFLAAMAALAFGIRIGWTSFSKRIFAGSLSSARAGRGDERAE